MVSEKGISETPVWFEFQNLMNDQWIACEFPESLTISESWYHSESMEFYFSETERIILMNRFEEPEDSQDIPKHILYAREYNKKHRAKLNEMNRIRIRERRRQESTNDTTKNL